LKHNSILINSIDGPKELLLTEVTISVDKTTHHCKALLDMGSQVPTILLETAVKWNLKINPSSSTIKTVTGIEKVCGVTDYLEIIVHGRSCDLPFYVLENNNGYDMILGLPWFARNNAGTRIQDGLPILQFGSESIILDTETLGDKDIELNLSELEVTDDIELFDQEWNFPDAKNVKAKEKLSTKEQKTFDEVVVPLAHNLFAKALSDLGCFTDGVHEIDLVNHKPIRNPLFRRSEFDRKRLKDETDALLKASKSECSSTPFMVPKPDGSARMVVNYIQLNKVTVKNIFPINRVDDTIEKVARFLWYTDLDLKQGYYQILLHIYSIKYTALKLR